MSKRLVKVAKELNVGTSTIVDFLQSEGFEIENKPTAKVSEEMEDALMKEFQASIEIKSQADKMEIGFKKSEEEKSPGALPTIPLFGKETKSKETESPASEITEKVVETPVVESKTETEEVEKAPVVESKTETEEVIEAKKESNSGLKVVGKIDLDEKKKPSTKKNDKKEEDEVPVEKVVEAKEVVEEEPKKVESKKKPDQLIKAEAPQLEGLKVQGKVDLKQFQKTKKEPVEDSDEDSTKKRRRRRKIITSDSESVSKPRNKKSNKVSKSAEDVAQVSQKEIDEKIKSTMARLSGGKRNKRQKIRRDKREAIREKEELKQLDSETGLLQVTEFISVQELANLMDISATEVITTCMNMGVIVSINQRLDAEIIELVASEFNQEIEFINAEEEVEVVEDEVDDPNSLITRAPIVTVMGHVDHGKTSLLDYIRKAQVAEGEAGGITQHIGSYEVKVGEDQKPITFLDTPGHEAFTAMRARGAKVTDIAVIIVAADDKIMPQTKEAISHAQAAGVPMIFAINKIDKEGADPERIKSELSEMNLLVEDWGGKYQSQDISAKAGTNIDLLLEKILLEAEILDLKANPDRMAFGTVLEASLEKGKGYVTNALVQNGTLEIGDPFFAGEHAGRVKAIFNDKGKRIKKAGPSTPVSILGLSGAPQAGEKFKVTDKEQEAKNIANKRSQIMREHTNRASKRISLEEIGRRLALGNFKELNLIVKGDVDGSVEALSDSLIKQSIESVQVNVIHKAVGQIVESDVLLASASDAIIIGFQVRPSLNARRLAETEGVEIKTYSVIYKAIDEIRAAIEGLLEPTKEESILGQVQVRETFKISRVGTIAGCYVEEGKITKNSNVRLIRDGIVVYPSNEGAVAKLSSLKRFKDDVKEVKSGMECGLSIENFNDIKVGDNIEAYEIVEVKQTLESQ